MVCEGAVYFVQGESGGPIKIGRSAPSRVQERLQSIQTGNQTRLVVRRVIALPRDSESQTVETALHWRFAEWRLVGEWFTDTRDLLYLAGGLTSNGRYLSKSGRILKELGLERFPDDDDDDVELWRFKTPITRSEGTRITSQGSSHGQAVPV